MAKSKKNPVLLADLMRVNGDGTDPRTAVLLAREDVPDVDVLTDAATALAAHGNETVVSCSPAPAGGHARNLYVLAKAGHGRTGYTRNPEPISFSIQSWRVGDTAWLIPAGAREPLAARISAVSYPTVKNPETLATLVPDARCKPTGTFRDVPSWALFKNPRDAIRAMACLAPDKKE